MALHDTTQQVQLYDFTLQYTKLHYTIPRYSTQHYSTLQYVTIRYTNYTTPQLQLQLQLHYTDSTHYITTTTYNYNLQLQLTTTTPLHYNYNYTYNYNDNYNCTTPHYIQQLWVRWPLQPLQPLQKTQLQPPFGSSVDSFCHPWVTTATLSYRFHSFETSATALCGTTGISHEPASFFIDGLVDSSLLVSLQWPPATTDTEDSDQKATSPRSFGAISTWKKHQKHSPRWYRHGKSDISDTCRFVEFRDFHGAPEMAELRLLKVPRCRNGNLQNPRSFRWWCWDNRSAFSHMFIDFHWGWWMIIDDYRWL